MHRTKKSEKPPSLTKTENQRLNKRKPANRGSHQNRKTAVFQCENRTKHWPNPQNRKSQRPPQNSIATLCLNTPKSFTTLQLLVEIGHAIQQPYKHSPVKCARVTVKKCPRFIYCSRVEDQRKTPTALPGQSVNGI